MLLLVGIGITENDWTNSLDKQCIVHIIIKHTVVAFYLSLCHLLGKTKSVHLGLSGWRNRWIFRQTWWWGDPFCWDLKPHHFLQISIGRSISYLIWYCRTFSPWQRHHQTSQSSFMHARVCAREGRHQMQTTFISILGIWNIGFIKL